MNNQTIDGVPRSLLSDLAGYGESGKVPEPWMVEELRALLDAPATGLSGAAIQRYADNRSYDASCVEADDGEYVLYSDYLKEISRLKAPQHQGEPVTWSYCPECGCEEIHHQEGRHKQCAACYQEWFSDIDYSDVVRGHLKKRVEQPAPVAVVLPFKLKSIVRTDYSDGWNACIDAATHLNTK